MRNDLRGSFAAVLRPGVALLLALCVLITALPTAAWAASSVGTGPSSLTHSTTKVYIRLLGARTFFTGDTVGTGTTVTVPLGTVCQLVTDDYYTASDGKEYYSVYYQNKRYNVLRSEVQGDVLTAAQVIDYITNTIWKQTVFDTLRPTMDLVGDIRVHAVQYALSLLGYYTGPLDGEYGDGTTNGVKKFQRANGLTADGSVGPLTQPLLFSRASGGAISGSTTVTQTGTLRTTSNVNLRKSGSTSSLRLGSVPNGTVLAYTDIYVKDGITWYQVRYNGKTGWLMGTYVTTTNSSGGSGGGSTTTVGTLRTTDKVNLRKSASKSSARLAVVPKGITLSYTSTSLRSGITWYRVVYNGHTGWLMGTFVSASGSGSGGGSGSSVAIGTVTITAPGTRVRKTANGSKTGTVLAKGTVVDLLAQPTTAGGYTWFNIRTGSGLVGYVRGDCATASFGGGSVTPTTSKTFIQLPQDTLLFTTETRPASGGVTVSKDTVLQMVDATTYTSGGVVHCKLYYNNEKYNVEYDSVKNGILSAADLATYVQLLWSSTLTTALKRENNLVGDVRVYAMQVALYTLGYYTGELDGNFGSGSESAVRNYQRKAKLGVDGACGPETWASLTAAVKGSSGGGGGGSITVQDFGTVNRVVIGTWDGDGVYLMPKSTYATVMDVATGKVFRIYRWSGGKHADCVPATAADTQIMCEIVGFPYNSSHPTSSQLNSIKADGNKSNVTYTWPDFKNSFGGAKDIGSDWDRRAALLNVNGTVYPVSIYGFPHGFTGTDSFSQSRFNDNSQLFYVRNNYYGMMCVHFKGSTTHSDNLDSRHQANINTAYDHAKKLWPTLVK